MSLSIRHDDLASQIATRADLRRFWIEAMQLPVKTSDGSVFQFDRDSKELMEEAILGLTASLGTANWRLEDNTEITVNASQLQAYYSELRLLRAQRAVQIDAEYVAKKPLVDAGEVSLRDLEGWKLSHQV